MPGEGALASEKSRMNPMRLAGFLSAAACVSMHGAVRAQKVEAPAQLLGQMLHPPPID